MGSSNSSTTVVLLLLACCCCSSSASGAGAYFLGYIPGNDKYNTRIFQLEKMFKILEDIKSDMKFEGPSPNKKYTGKIDKDFCDTIKDFKENLDEKRDDQSDSVSDADFKKLVETYMKDNEIKGYTYKQAMDIIDFLYASCGTNDKRVFKKTTEFTDKLTKLFGMVTPTTNTWTAQRAFCDDVTGDNDVVTKGFTSLHKEITDVTAVSSLDQLWDESTGTLGLSGFSLTDLTSSVDYCKTPIAKTCVEMDQDDCDTDNVCTWTPESTVTGADSVVTTTPASCGDIPACNTFTTSGSIPSATTDCPLDRCQWNDAVGTTPASCGDKTT